MSETRPYGEPVDEPVATDPDVAARANEGLADADAARRSDQQVWTPDASEPPAAVWTPATADSRTDPADSRTATDTDGSDTLDSRADTAAGDDEYVPGAYATRLYDADPDVDPAPPASRPDHAPTTTTRLYDAEPAPSAPLPDADRASVAAVPAPEAAAAAETVAVAPVVTDPARQPIFVQAPDAPIARGNRAAAGAIGLLAALAFAVLYLGVALGLGALTGTVTGATIGAVVLAALASWSLWVPVVAFFLAFWLLGAVLNRARWGKWVVFGLLVGVAAYAGSIAGELVQAPFWTLTAREGAELAASRLLAPLSVAAFVIGRELTIWFGAWVARRGRRVTELNAEAQREYERTLEAGPKLYAS